MVQEKRQEIPFQIEESCTNLRHLKLTSLLCKLNMVTRDSSAFESLLHKNGIMRDVGHVIYVVDGGDNRLFHLLLNMRVIASLALMMARRLIMLQLTVIAHYLIK